MYPGHVENVDLRHQFQISAITTDIFRSMEWNGVIFWILKRRRRKIHGVVFWIIKIMKRRRRKIHKMYTKILWKDTKNSIVSSSRHHKSSKNPTFSKIPHFTKSTFQNLKSTFFQNTPPPPGGVCRDRGYPWFQHIMWI